MSEEVVNDEQEVQVSRSIVTKEAAEALRNRPADDIRNLIDASTKVGKKVDVNKLFHLAEINGLSIEKFNAEDAGKVGFVGRLAMTVSAMLRSRYKKGETIHGYSDELGSFAISQPIAE